MVVPCTSQVQYSIANNLAAVLVELYMIDGTPKYKQVDVLAFVSVARSAAPSTHTHTRRHTLNCSAE